jgi:conjugal transfer pilus assembly protein TraU
MSKQIMAMALSFLLFAGSFGTAFAQGTTTTGSTSTSATNANTGGAKCPSSHLLGAGLFDKVCWTCMFPVYLFGRLPISTGDKEAPFARYMSLPDAGTRGTAPEGHNTSMACTCGTGLNTRFGYSVGLWVPARVIELTRQSGCSPALGGVTLMSDPLMVGGPKPRTKHDNGTNKIYMNYNDWVFPLVKMLGLLVHQNCNADGYASMDMATSSMFDPTHSRDDLALIMDPEAFAVGNPFMLAACAADGVMCTASESYCMEEERNRAFWCAGSWGNLTPYTGNLTHSGSPPRDTSLMATRILAKFHRLGRLRKTYGHNALCPDTREFAPMLPKTQYKMQTVFPIAEASGRCCHAIGESQYKWGEWRNIPGFEDYVYMVWRWADCCLLQQ